MRALLWRVRLIRTPRVAAGVAAVEHIGGGAPARTTRGVSGASSQLQPWQTSWRHE